MVPILRKHDQDRMCIYSRTLTCDSNSGGKQGVNPGAQQTRSGCPCPTLISLEDPQSLFILRQCGRSESHQAIQSSPLMASYSDISYSRGVDKFTRYVTWPLVRTVSKY